LWAVARNLGGTTAPFLQWKGEGLAALVSSVAIADLPRKATREHGAVWVNGVRRSGFISERKTLKTTSYFAMRYQDLLSHYNLFVDDGQHPYFCPSPEGADVWIFGQIVTILAVNYGNDCLPLAKCHVFRDLPVRDDKTGRPVVTDCKSYRSVYLALCDVGPLVMLVSKESSVANTAEEEDEECDARIVLGAPSSSSDSRDLRQ
jgi:hypothetical protein